MGAWIGCAGIVIVVFISGLCGWLAAWGGLLDYSIDENLFLFYVSRRCAALGRGEDTCCCAALRCAPGWHPHKLPVLGAAARK